MAANADLHMHSVFSFDGKARPREIARTAFERGAKAIAFTEHFDAMPPRYDDPMATDNRPHYLKNEPEALASIRSLQETYKGKMDILYAVELGQPMVDPEACRAFVAARDFDYVLGSVHNTPAGRDYYHVDYDTDGVERHLTRYYDDMLRLVKFGLLDCVAHLDYPVRVMEKWLTPGAPMAAYRDRIAEILTAAAGAKLPLEINTSGLHRWFNRVHPEDWVLRLFKDLGGTAVTVGSDTHKETYAMYGVAEAEALAESCGLKVIAGFKNREPYFRK